MTKWPESGSGAIRLRGVGAEGTDTEARTACPARRPGHDDNATQHRLANLLQAARNGDRESFTLFYRETSLWVFGLTRRIMRSPAAVGGALRAAARLFAHVRAVTEGLSPPVNS